MRIQYQPGDLVIRSADPDGPSYIVDEVKKQGLVLEDERGERFYVGCRQVEPCPGTVTWAEWIQNPEP